MSDIKVLSAGAVKAMVAALGAEFERAGGGKLDLVFNTAGSLRERIENGEVADLVILSESLIAALDKRGLVVSGSITDLGRTVTGVIVREGAAAPDISTPAAFKQALLDASSVAYTDPKAGGSGGIMFVGLLDRLGIADAVNKKAVLCKGGFDVSAAVAEGRAELGTTFISEALPVKGLTIVGPLPGDLHYTNTYTAAVHAGSANPDGARALLRALTDPATRDRWQAAGLEPAF
ncbi:MAG: substrate-binding domain-containing protein [Pseudolabrys sp.]|nr:substrate-binding domain-containing protein [Pseudolabrys sp.]